MPFDAWSGHREAFAAAFSGRNRFAYVSDVADLRGADGALRGPCPKEELRFLRFLLLLKCRR